MQPVLVQSFRVSLNCLVERLQRLWHYVVKCWSWYGSEALNLQDATKYCSRTALCMYKMQWSKPDIYNATQDCAKHMSAPALKHLMKYVIDTADQGLVLFPDQMLGGSLEFKFQVHGRLQYKQG
jgi:hypothetical protein